MISKENAKLAVGLAMVLLVVGIVCYAIGGPETDPEYGPIRKVFRGVAGDVMFDHQAHMDYEGDCTTCHHHGSDNGFKACDTCHLAAVPKQVPQVCNDCHPLTDDPYLQDAYHAHHALLEDEPDQWSCKTCHQLEEGETLPYACGDCHDPADVEGQAKIMKYQKIDDAMHSQCIGCHEDYGVGPVACNECHAK
jgi:hypothetical protein